MKLVPTIAAAVVLAASLTACGSKDKPAAVAEVLLRYYE